MVLRTVSAYRNVSTSAVLVLASVLPIDLLAKERKETFQLRKELTCLTNLQEIARVKEAICKNGKRTLVEKWQTKWYSDQTGRWTHRLIPELASWLVRKHGQALSVPGEVRKGRLSVGQWAHNSLLTRWSLSCSSLNRYGCFSSHSSPW